MSSDEHGPTTSSLALYDMIVEDCRRAGPRVCQTVELHDMNSSSSQVAAGVLFAMVV